MSASGFAIDQFFLRSSLEIHSWLGAMKLYFMDQPFDPKALLPGDAIIVFEVMARKVGEQAILRQSKAEQSLPRGGTPLVREKPRQGFRGR